MTPGVWVVVAAIAIAVLIGIYRARTDGRARAVAGDDQPRLDASSLGAELGGTATFVQFSAAVCAPCAATRRVLGEIAAAREDVAHVEVAVEDRPDLVESFSVMRTPTVLVLDAHGVPRQRITGATRLDDALAALLRVADDHHAASNR